MNVRYRVELSQAERGELTAMLSKGRRAARKLKRAQILLAADAGCSDEEIARTVAVGECAGGLSSGDHRTLAPDTQRRSQKGGLTWARMAKLADDWLPKPRILHPWPNQRFAVRHPRWEKLWGGRRRSWQLHRPYEPMEVSPWPKSMISAEA